MFYKVSYNQGFCSLLGLGTVLKKRGCVISHIQYALKGQKHLAQGSALGFRTNTKKSP